MKEVYYSVSAKTGSIEINRWVVLEKKGEFAQIQTRDQDGETRIESVKYSELGSEFFPKDLSKIFLPNVALDFEIMLEPKLKPNKRTS